MIAEGLKVGSHVRFVTTEDGGVLLDVGTGKYYSLNVVGIAVWSGLKEQQTLQEIVTSLMSKFNLPPEKVRSDVAAFLNHLLELRLIETI